MLAALPARATMNKGVFFFLLTLCPTYSIHWLLKLKLTRGSRFSPNGLGIDQFPEGLGRSRRGPQYLGLRSKGARRYWNACHTQTLDLVPGDTIFSFQKTKTIEELIVPKFSRHNKHIDS